MFLNNFVFIIHGCLTLLTPTQKFIYLIVSKVLCIIKNCVRVGFVPLSGNFPSVAAKMSERVAGLVRPKYVLCCDVRLYINPSCFLPDKTLRRLAIYCALNLSFAHERKLPLQLLDALMRFTIPVVFAGYPASLIIHPDAELIVESHPFISDCVYVLCLFQFFQNPMVPSFSPR